MKQFKCLAILLTCFTAMLMWHHGNAQESANNKGTIEQAVTSLTKAMIDGSKEQLMASTHPKLSYGHSSGRIEGREEFIANIVSGRSDFVTIDIADQAVTMVDNHTALVRHTLFAVTNDNGKPGEIKLHILLVFVREHKKWLLVGRQAVRPPQ